MNTRIDWRTVNWAQQDVVLAEQLGCSRERVRQVRQEMSKPKPEGHRRKTQGTARLMLSKEATEIATLPKLSKLTGRKEETVRTVLKQLGKGYKRRPHGRARYEWQRFPAGWAAMTDKDIAVIVGANDPVIVTQWRIRHGHLKKRRAPGTTEISSSQVLANPPSPLPAPTP